MNRSKSRLPKNSNYSVKNDIKYAFNLTKNVCFYIQQRQLCLFKCPNVLSKRLLISNEKRPSENWQNN